MQAIKGADHNKVLIFGGHQVTSLSRVTVIPCCAGNEGNRRGFQRKYDMENIFQTPFKQIWKSQKYSQFLSLAHNNDIPVQCQFCPVFPVSTYKEDTEEPRLREIKG